MAELPDLQVFAININKMFAGKKLLKIEVINGKKLADNQQQLTKILKGKILKEVYRSGKELRFKFKDDTLMGMHLMLTGDIFPFDKTNIPNSTIIAFYFEGDHGLALTDRMRNANIKLNPVDKAGVDAVSKELNYKYLLQALKKKRTIKDVMMDQNIIRGLGNSYSDEILWQTKINPYSIAEAIPAQKIKELVKVIKKTLNNATNKILETYPDKVNVEVKEFMKVHTKQRTETPTGHTIKIDTKGMRKTYYTDEQILYK